MLRLNFEKVFLMFFAEMVPESSQAKVANVAYSLDSVRNLEVSIAAARKFEYFIFYVISKSISLSIEFNSF